MHSRIFAFFLLTSAVAFANDAEFDVAYSAESLSTVSYSSMKSTLTGMLNKLSVVAPPGIVCADCAIASYQAQSPLGTETYSSEEVSSYGFFDKIRKQLEKAAKVAQCGLGPCLASSFGTTQVKPFQGKTTRTKLEATLKSNGLPAAAIKKIKAIVFSESVVFQTFESRININAARGILLEVVGAARRTGDAVEFGVLQSNVQVRLVKKSTTVKKRSCKRVLFVKKCKNRNVQVPRGYSAPELSKIEKLMLSKSNQLMKGVSNKITIYSVSNEADLTLPTIENAGGDVSPFSLSKESTESLRDAVIKFVDRFPYLKDLLENEETTTNVTIKKITNRGFKTFSRSATLQAIDNVDPGMYDQFVIFALRVLSIKSEKVEMAVKKEIFDMVPLATNSDWIMYRILFQEEEGGKCNYVCVLGHNNLGKGYDFVFATFGMDFELAPDILVIEESKSSGWGMVGSSKTRIVEIPVSMKYKDVDTLFKFFDLAAFTRFAKMLNVALPSSDIVQ